MTNKAVCPSCGAKANAVSTQTVKHQLQKPWQWKEAHQDYYFCAARGCDTVYFSGDECITQSRLRQRVGIKCDDADALLCYCFAVRRADATDPDIKAYVVAQTKAKQCACKVRNPSGRCCLNDFP